jgi:SAM-dependent methyltransferase
VGTRWQGSDAPRGDDYDARWTALAAKGRNVHGEADLVETLLRESAGTRVLDAGCGTGRVAIELAERGFSVTGVDADATMLTAARTKAPDLTWLEADLTDLHDRLEAEFDLVALAGNVMIFLSPGTEQRVLAQLAGLLAPGGLLVAGFQLRTDRLSLADYDRMCASVGLEPVARWATWDRQPFADGDYAVSTHRRVDAQP